MSKNDVPPPPPPPPPTRNVKGDKPRQAPPPVNLPLKK